MNLKHSAKILSFLLLAQILTGCALTRDEIALSYTVRGGRDRVPGASDIKVEVKIADQRQDPSIVGRKINGFGMETAAILSTNDVVELVRGAIGTELEMRGFARGDGVVVTGDLSKYYNRFKLGFWAGDSIAELILNIQIRGKDGTILFTKNIIAEGLEPNIQMALGHNAKLSLQDALAKAMEQLFQAPGFIPALFKAAGRPEPETK
jgi:uncharacterized lipoprotein